MAYSCCLRGNPKFQGQGLVHWFASLQPRFLLGKLIGKAIVPLSEPGVLSCVVIQQQCNGLLFYEKTLTKINPGRKGSFGLHFPSIGHHVEKSGQELKGKPGDRSQCRGHGGCYLRACSFWLAWSAFLYTPGSLPGVTAHTWSLHIKKMLPRLAHRPI